MLFNSAPGSKNVFPFVQYLELSNGGPMRNVVCWLLSSVEEPAIWHWKLSTWIPKRYECYELVEALSREVIIAWGVWYHLNFTARHKTLDGKGGSELFFAELNTITQKITTFKSLEPTGDGPVPKNGCRYCSTSLKPEIFHPGNDDFVMGSPNPKMALEYQQNNQKSF